ncbi:hypothetical protein VTL71DRAFT_5741 [Oculimacula yallundae]|uniref:Helicase C-terminal domain-containing protein n=1 Tax=Oculimacula yallundae TaxID=86028 RepID=A0ABR4BYC0_9HELO
MENCTQFDEITWKNCCAFFFIDPENHSPDLKVKVRGLKEDFWVYQAYAIFWMMSQSRTPAGGGFCSDEKGLGRVRVELGLCIMEYILANAWTEVEAARNSENAVDNIKHNSINASKTALSCPSEVVAQGNTDSYPFAIPCPCWAGSISSKFELKNGASLILLSNACNTSAWEKEFTRILHPKGHIHYLPLDLVVVPKFSSEIYERLGPAEKEELDDRLLDTFVEEGRVPGLGHTRFIFVSSDYHYREYIKDVYERGGGRNPEEHSVYWSKILISQHHLETRKDSTIVKIMQVSGNDFEWGSPFMWAFSGTPFEENPEDLEPYIAFLRDRVVPWTDPDDDPNYVPYVNLDDDVPFGYPEDIKSFQSQWIRAPLSHAKLDGDETEHNFGWICQEYKRQLACIKQLGDGVVFNQRAVNKSRSTMTHYLGEVLQALMIRRTSKSRWFGAPLKQLTKNYRHRLLVGTFVFAGDTYFEEDLTELRAITMLKVRNFGPNDIRFRHALRFLRMSATIPGIANLILGIEPSWELTEEELQRPRLRPGGEVSSWYSDTSGSPYSLDRERLLNYSEKLLELDNKILKNLEEDPTTGKQEKIIVLSNFPAVAYIMYMYMVRKLGEIPVLLIHEQTPHRKALLEGSQRRRNGSGFNSSDRLDKNAYNRGYFATCVVSTPTIIGQEHSLTRATRVILMEPSWTRRDEEQAFSCVRNFSQTQKTHTYRFVNKSTLIEDHIINRQKGQNTMSSESLRKTVRDRADFGTRANPDHPIFNRKAPVVVDLLSDDDEELPDADDAEVISISSGSDVNMAGM